MITSVLQKTKIVLIAFVILSFACTNRSKEYNASDEFYNNLRSQISTGDFISPLKVSQAGKIEQTQEISFTENNDGIECTGDSESYRISFSPISLVRTGSGKQKDASYVIKLFLKDGTTLAVTKLQKPAKRGNTIVFQTDADGVEIEFQAYESYVKWRIGSDKNITDSLSVAVTTKGPYFGGGERFLSSVLDGRAITNQPMDHYRLIEAKDESIDEEFIRNYEPSYLQIPFIMTPGGLGWYFDNAATTNIKFDQGSEFFEVKMPGSMADFYVFNEDTPKEILNSYTGLMGRQPALPEWAFGVWITALEGKDSVYAKVHKLKQWEIPANAIWMYDFEDLETSSGFSVPRSYQYGDIRQLTDSLHNMGFKVITYVHPFSFRYDKDPKIAKTIRAYNYLDSLNLILRLTRTLDPTVYKIFNMDGQYDFYKPGLYEIWKSFLNQLVNKNNFDGWMEDFGDVGYTYNMVEKKWEAIPVEIDHSMSDHEFFNMYPLVFHKLTHQLYSGLGKEVVSFSRSGSAGSAAYCPLIWGGDQTGSWDKKFGYPSAITAALSIGMSGYGNWTPDILSDSPSKELWMRWVQFGAFTPLMRDHLWNNDPKMIDLWFDESTRQYFKKYAEIHNQLIPYLKTAADYYQQTGCPIIRHMILEFPDDKETYKCEYQYMLGDKLLVAPVVEEGAKSNNVYFPRGVWRDYWTKKEFSSSGEWMTIPAPADLIPVFEKVSV